MPAPDGPDLAGVAPFSSIDYPGRLATVVFVAGCPWRCGYCHNPHLQQKNCSAAGRVPWAEFLRWLKTRTGLLDAVVFSGGEPSLTPKLDVAIRAVRDLGFAVGMHSAGVAPRRLEQLLPHLDWLGLDIKALPEDYATISGNAGSGAAAFHSLDLALQAKLPLEVRTTYAPPLYAETRLRLLAQTLADRGVKTYALQGLREHPGAPPWQVDTALQRWLASLFPQFCCR